MSDLTPEQVQGAAKVALDGAVILEEQIRSLGLSEPDYRLLLKFRRDCDNLWAESIDQSSGQAKYVRAIRAYFLHISEDFQRLLEQHGESR